MHNLITVQSGSLDCYSKSIDDFIKYLRNHLLDDIRFCKNTKEYTKYSDFFTKLEKQLQTDDFIKKFFDHNRNEINIEKRLKVINDILEKDMFFQFFQDYFSGKKIVNFYIMNIDLFDENNFYSVQEKQVAGNKQIFDEVFLDEKRNKKIYLEYKVKAKNYYACAYVSSGNENMDERVIFDSLKSYTNFVIEHGDDASLLDFNHSGYFFIKKEVDKNRKGNIDPRELNHEMSEEILSDLHKELMKYIILDDDFIYFLNSFIPSNDLNK